MNNLSYNRETQTIVELRQPRCSNRFGVSPCTATGTPKCYQCYWTCGDTENYNTDGSITWRFSKKNDPVAWLYEESDEDNFKTNAIPLLLSVTTSSSRLNIGASRTGESPLGRRATAQIVMSNDPWDDNVGDFYKDERTEPSKQPGFWSLFKARNPFSPNFEVTIYEGYVGQTLAEMQQRHFDVENISGPDESNRFTITCRDPLDKLRGKNTKYPPISRIDLAESIGAATTVIPVSCLESELTADYGNVTDIRYLSIGNEIIGYTGYTGTEPDFVLTGVRRAQFNTTAGSYDELDAMQRVAYHRNQELYLVAKDIIKNHSPIKTSYINDTQWSEEGDTYLSTLKCNTLLPEPVDADELLGELCRDGMFSIWWDDRDQTIPLIAVRPPKTTPVLWSEDNNTLKFDKEVRADERMSRVTVYFGVRNWFEDLDEPANYINRRTRIDLEVEDPVATGGDVFDNTIFSRWVQTFGNALLVEAALLQRYRLPPEFLDVTLDAKDRSIKIGEVVDLEHSRIVDIEGNPLLSRWQVIAVEEPNKGSTVFATLQSYSYVGKFAVIMANDAPDYSSATDEEKLNGCWLADESTGLMPDGSDPYLLQ